MDDPCQGAGAWFVQLAHDRCLRRQGEGGVIDMWGGFANDLEESGHKLKAVIYEVESW